MVKGSVSKGLLAISPLAVFLLVYLVSSLVAGDFYKVPVSAAFLFAGVYGVAVMKGPLKERLAAFSRGAGHPNVMLMIWIFLLSGAFAQTARQIGAVDATVSLMLEAVPARWLLSGLFVTSCFISMAMGTSVGTIVALVPIGAGIAAQCDIPEAYMAAVIVGGSFFGDNLSFISDTTIASTRAAGCEMRDKFRANLRIVLPAFLAVTVLYIIRGGELVEVPVQPVSQWYRALPYLLIIVLALLGLNVTVVLSAGLASVALLGFISGDLTWVDWLGAVGEGIAGMSELIIVTLLAGGLLELIRMGGGLNFIIETLSRGIRGRRGAEAAIAGIVGLANLCTANNTVAIITTGGIAHDIAERFGVPPQKTASLLDTFSCLVQGLIPYGAQLLMASGLAGISPAAIIPHLYYPFLMGFCAIVSILFYKKTRSGAAGSKA
ncbi:MAG: Na+/H+ antiporter NhaC family protein [Bacteroidales bacterium]|nr:Na+/H+ antiporter NhaC family protein [Bacteroidales bacterium]